MCLNPTSKDKNIIVQGGFYFIRIDIESGWGTDHTFSPWGRVERKKYFPFCILSYNKNIRLKGQLINISNKSFHNIGPSLPMSWTGGRYNEVQGVPVPGNNKRDCGLDHNS